MNNHDLLEAFEQITKADLESIATNLERLDNPVDAERFRKEAIGIVEVVVSVGDFILPIRDKIIDGWVFLLTKTANRLATTLQSLEEASINLLIGKSSDLVEQSIEAGKMLLYQSSSFITLRMMQGGMTGLDQLRNQIESETQSLEDRFKATSQRAEAELSKFQSAIERSLSESRKTRVELTTDSAKQQYKQAISEHKKTAKNWRIISALIALLMISTVLFVDTRSDNLNIDIPSLVNKLTIIAILATTLAYSLRMLKANEHLRIISSHRLKIIEALPEFVQSMYTMEQGDVVLADLIRQFSDLGQTGILEISNKDDSSSIFIDTLVKNISRTWQK